MKPKAILTIIIFIFIMAGWACGGEVTVYPTGTVSGLVLDANPAEISNATLLSLSDATVTLTQTSALFADDDTVVPSPTTSLYDGTFTFYNVPCGDYKITISATGKSDIVDTFTVEPNQTKSLAAFAMSDEAADPGTKIWCVLTWNNKQDDLDIHVTYPQADDPNREVWRSDRNMVYHGNRQTSEDPVYLEIDMLGSAGSGPGYGPETVYFDFDDDAPNGIYMVTVFGYDDMNADTPQAATELGLSDATVRFCDEWNGCWLSSKVPYNAVGNQWVAGYFDWDGETMEDGQPYLYAYDMNYLDQDAPDLVNFDILSAN